MLPVADVIAKEWGDEDFVSAIIGIEIHVESIDGAVLVIIDDDCGGHCIRGGARGVRGNTKEVTGLRVCGEVAVGSEVDERAVVGISDGVESVKIVEGEGIWIGGRGKISRVELRVRVAELGGYVGGVVGVA